MDFRFYGFCRNSGHPDGQSGIMDRLTLLPSGSERTGREWHHTLQRDAAGNSKHNRVSLPALKTRRICKHWRENVLRATGRTNERRTSGTSVTGRYIWRSIKKHLERPSLHTWLSSLYLWYQICRKKLRRKNIRYPCGVEEERRLCFIHICTGRNSMDSQSTRKRCTLQSSHSELPVNYTGWGDLLHFSGKSDAGGRDLSEETTNRNTEIWWGRDIPEFFLRRKYSYWSTENELCDLLGHQSEMFHYSWRVSRHIIESHSQ